MNRIRNNFFEKKSPFIYIFSFILSLIFSSTFLFLFIWFAKIGEVSFNKPYIYISIFTVVINFFPIFFSLVFINNELFSIFLKNKFYKNIYQIYNSAIINEEPKVVIIHMVCNDFIPEILRRIMRQKYKNIEYVICSDSSKTEEIQKEDAFAKKHNLYISRRPSEHRKQFGVRAGNWNYYINSEHAKQFQYIVFTDAGSLIQDNFINNTLPFFYSPLINNKKIAFVQEKIFCPECRSLWSKIFSKWWAVLEDIKFGLSKYGHNTTGGFGCIYSMNILKKIPLEKVAIYCDDLSTSAYLVANGYEGIYSPLETTCKIRPYNFISFFYQQNKWAYNNLALKNKKTLIGYKYKCSFAEKISILVNCKTKDINLLPTILTVLFLYPVYALYFQNIQIFWILILLEVFLFCFHLFLGNVLMYGWMALSWKNLFSIVMIFSFSIVIGIYSSFDVFIRGIIFKKNFRAYRTPKYDKKIGFLEFFKLNKVVFFEFLCLISFYLILFFTCGKSYTIFWLLISFSIIFTFSILSSLLANITVNKNFKIENINFQKEFPNDFLKFKKKYDKKHNLVNVAQTINNTK